MNTIKKFEKPVQRPAKYADECAQNFVFRINGPLASRHSRLLFSYFPLIVDGCDTHAELSDILLKIKPWTAFSAP